MQALQLIQIQLHKSGLRDQCHPDSLEDAYREKPRYKNAKTQAGIGRKKKTDNCSREVQNKNEKEDPR